MGRRIPAGANEVNRRNVTGFTAIELMVAIAVLGVLAAVAFPSLRDYIDRQRLVGQVRAIANMAQLARSEAIKRSAASAGGGLSNIAMTINPGTSWSVGLAAGNAACTGTSCVIQGSADTQIITGTDCPSCTLAVPTAQTVIVFDLRGLVTGGTDRLITMSSPMGKQLSLSVSRLGRISLCTPSASIVGFPSC